MCRQRGGSFKLKGIQSLAFVLWKQQHLSDAVKLFHEMEEIMGTPHWTFVRAGHLFSCHSFPRRT